jgi:hypothetical protein
MEGVSDETLVFFSVCLLSMGCGYLGDKLLSRYRVRSVAIGPGAVDGAGAVDSLRGPRQVNDNPRTTTGFSESEIAVQGGQLPLCPICLEQVSNAVETSWYLCVHHTDFMTFPSSFMPSPATSCQPVSSHVCGPVAMHSARSASWRCGSEPKACKAVHDSRVLSTGERFPACSPPTPCVLSRGGRSVLANGRGCD